MILATLAVALAFLNPSAPPPPPPPLSCSGVVTRINTVRSHYGLAPMTPVAPLRVAAQKWADTTPMTHGDWIGRIRAEGVTDPDLGEIIAWGYSTPRDVVRAWMESPPHRRVVLASSSFLQKDGAGCHWGSGSSRWFVVVDFSGQ